MQRFQVGDIVRIREWDDMEDEFGVDFSGAIKCNGVFTPSMRYLCGLELQIASIDNVKTFPSTDRDGYIVHFKMKNKLRKPGKMWIPMITNEMLELVRNHKELICVNTTVIDDFLDMRRV